MKAYDRLVKPPNPEMFDFSANASGERLLMHDMDVECGVDRCRDARHFRLLDLDERTEIKDSHERIDAMREVWHNHKD